ncbi:DUF4344 domain-containing metallopeptidase [Parasulfitobacter algicola]|uniref:Metallopeptidase n=1 Tax=Parasulfitobacter algicola TaxID=2614809 RepID=A0ABX2IWQ9_9RHOB|nr:DUF4344 domain-containing metallopeptidase [Sulfitobacter algicola]NSX54718.1 hypothetical protein [Sulfitobacter algicola]
MAHCLKVLSCALALPALVAWPVQAQDPVTPFAEDVLLHVIAHEIGHAVIREFDLPILAREEMQADMFATLAISLLFPERSDAVIRARVQSLLLEGDDESVFSEYPDDYDRAGQILCLYYGLASQDRTEFAQEFGLTGDDATNCRGTAPEIARSWRRLTAPLLRPDYAPVTEVAIRYAETDIPQALSDSETMQQAYTLLATFDWHSMITLRIESCEDTAYWQRNGRVLMVCDSYIERFNEQAGQITP